MAQSPQWDFGALGCCLRARWCFHTLERQRHAGPIGTLPLRPRPTQNQRCSAAILRQLNSTSNGPLQRRVRNPMSLQVGCNPTWGLHSMSQKAMAMPRGNLRGISRIRIRWSQRLPMHTSPLLQIPVLPFDRWLPTNRLRAIGPLPLRHPIPRESPQAHRTTR